MTVNADVSEPAASIHALARACQIVAGDVLRGAPWPDFASLAQRFAQIPGPCSYTEATMEMGLVVQFAARADSADDATEDDNRKPNPFVFAGEHRGSVEARSKKTLSALRRAKAISFDCHRHDLRRTAATLMQAAGVPDGHIAKVLNHRIRLDVGRVTAVYTRHPFDAEKRVALETLERRIAAILAAKDQSTANVVPFAR